MRIGIDYRILAVGPELITRGMGRYTQQQLREVLRVDHDDEFVLLCLQGADLSLVDPEVRDAENVSIKFFDPSLRYGETAGPEWTLRRAERFQSWIGTLGLDLYHATTPLALMEPQIASFDVCPMVATFYDVIPLLFAEHYLDGWKGGDDWRRALHIHRDAERLLAISAAARDEAQRCLGVDAERIDVAYPFPEPVFRRLSRTAVETRAAAMRARIGLRVPGAYALAVTYPHHTKNVGTLLDAYASVPRWQRAELPLIICCYLDERTRAQLIRDLDGRGIGEDVILTGVVSDDELALLYNCATLLIHPSRHEGYGLPVAEAMRCGAPVITTTATSLPEIAGDAAVLVDPDDAAGLAQAIEWLARDPSMRAELRRRGFEQSARFTGEALAEATLRSYRTALGVRAAESAVAAPYVRMIPARPRLAMWTPLPPQQTGIADYSAELIGALASAYDIELFVDDNTMPEERLFHRFRIEHHTAFARREAQSPFDAVVYQLGCSMFHGYMADALPAHPGVGVLHDLAWSPVLLGRAIHRGDVDGFLRELGEEEGEIAVQRLASAGRDGVEPARCLLEFPMVHRLVDPTIAQIVHSPAAAAQLRSRTARARPFVVPMGVADPYASDPRLTRGLARSRLGIRGSTFVIGLFGILHRVKRPEAAIRALHGLTGRGVDAVLLVVGRSLLGDEYVEQLVALAQELGVGERLRILGHVDRAAFDSALVACDVLVNLRLPTAHEVSAVAMRALAAGRPVVMTDVPDGAALPAGCCLPVPFEDGEQVPALVDGLEALATDRGLLERMSAHARAHYEAEGTLELMAARYADVLRTVTGAAATAAPTMGRAV